MTLCSKLSERPPLWPQTGVTEVDPREIFPDHRALFMILAELPIYEGSTGLRLCGACGLYGSCEAARAAVASFDCLAFQTRQDLSPRELGHFLEEALKRLEPDTTKVFPPPQ